MDSMYEFLLIHPHCTLVLDNIRLLRSRQCSGYKMVSHSLILNLCDYYWECTFSFFVYLHLYSLLWGMSVLFLMIFLLAILSYHFIVFYILWLYCFFVSFVVQVTCLNFTCIFFLLYVFWLTEILNFNVILLIGLLSLLEFFSLYLI